MTSERQQNERPFQHYGTERWTAGFWFGVFVGAVGMALVIRLGMWLVKGLI